MDTEGRRCGEPVSIRVSLVVIGLLLGGMWLAAVWPK